MLECNQERLNTEGLAAIHPEIRSELIETHLMLYKSNKRPEHLLEVAELAIQNNDYETAEINLKVLLERDEVSTEIASKARSHLTTIFMQH
jgi:hypothetical protein